MWTCPAVGSEALAYTTEHILDRAENGLSKAGTQDPTKVLATKLQSDWNFNWKTLNNLSGTNVFWRRTYLPIFWVTDYSRSLTTADLVDAKNRLGVVLSASGLLSKYRSWLKLNGYQVTAVDNNFTTFTLNPEFQ